MKKKSPKVVKSPKKAVRFNDEDDNDEVSIDESTPQSKAISNHSLDETINNLQLTVNQLQHKLTKLVSTNKLKQYLDLFGQNISDKIIE